MELLTSTPVIVTIGCAVIAAITDVTRFKVYNVLTIPLIFTGIIYHSLTGGLNGLTLSFVGAIIGFGLLIVPFVLGGIGGGDVKLLAGIGAWVGMPAILVVFILAGLMSGICAIVMMLWQERSLSKVVISVFSVWHQFKTVGQKVATESWVDNRVTANTPRRRVIPFGVMVALAVSMTFLLAGLR